MKLLKFSAAWCQPCKQLDVFLAEALLEYPEIELVSMPIEDNKDSVSYYGIRTVPT